MYNVSATDGRLKRLVMSDICRGKNPEKYAAELKGLARKVGDEPYLRSKERFFKALGDSTRLKIIRMLAAKEMCVCEIMVALDLTEPNASHHLNLLERNGIVKSEKMGRWVFYKIEHTAIRNLSNTLGS